MARRKSEALRTGWSSWFSRLSAAALLYLAVSGLVITLVPFHGASQWNVLLHTAVGLVFLIPLAWYLVAHWLDYKRYNLSDVVLFGYTAGVALVVCGVSGVVVTWQGLAGVRTSPAWRDVHLYSTVALLAVGVPHLLLIVLRLRRQARAVGPRRMLWGSLGATLFVGAVVAVLTYAYAGPRYVNQLPDDYSFVYGPDRPFAPSLARTVTGGALDAESLSGSETCGSAGCHTQIFEEWRPSAHRYAAMDVLFQGVQKVMAQQNGPESTRYCGGCHDPISLFSGAKNVLVEDLTGHTGYQEGVSCLSCHSIRETDLQGNANYVMTQPASYLWQWSEGGAGKVARDFLIRTYPAEHALLSKRMFKAPEYCAACHKQFVDQEVNKVGWVQLQNQYDNWKSSHWYHEGDAARTVECRECHMPLVDSSDPAAGDDADYNRTPNDGKHRSHRFLAANELMPRMLQLPGWEKHVELTERWLAGRYEVPEIRDKWVEGPVVGLALDVPESVPAGGTLPVRVVLTANKVGHDFPTGPLDIIQSWVELEVTDEAGQVIFASGRRDEKNFIEPGSFLFKAEPVDRYGNLIDRHNLWEMVGVRYRRAIFPGYSDSVEYLVDCPGAVEPAKPGENVAVAPRGKDGEPEVSTREVEVAAAEPGTYLVTARLNYRKVDQYLLNFLLGEDAGVTAPVTEMTEATATVRIGERAASTAASDASATTPAAR